MSAPTPDDDALVVDSSVVIKWHVAEAHSAAALRLLEDDAPALHAPDLLFPEVGNILWKKVTRMHELSGDDALAIAGMIVATPGLAIHPAAPLLEAALEVGFRTGRTAYDSLYVALAVRLNCRLVTADERLANALQGGPFAAHIIRVEDVRI